MEQISLSYNLWNPQGPEQGWEKSENSRVESKFCDAPDGIWSPNANESSETCKSTTFMSKMLPTVRHSLLSFHFFCQMYKKWIYGKRYCGWNSCQTSPGSIIKQHLSFRKPNFNKLKQRPAFSDLQNCSSFSSLTDPTPISFFHPALNKDLQPLIQI